MDAVFLVLVELLVLHGHDGTEITVNPAHVTSLRPRNVRDGKSLFTPGVECLINLSDGKFVTVKESCNEVRSRLNRRPP